MALPFADDDDNNVSHDPTCVVWQYSESPEAFERAGRFALQQADYGQKVVIVFTEAGARLLQVDRMREMLRVPRVSDLIDALDHKEVYFELDIASARRAGVVETIGELLPRLRIADHVRVAELATCARTTARY